MNKEATQELIVLQCDKGLTERLIFSSEDFEICLYSNNAIIDIQDKTLQRKEFLCVWRKYHLRVEMIIKDVFRDKSLHTKCIPNAKLHIQKTVFLEIKKQVINIQLYK